MKTANIVKKVNPCGGRYKNAGKGTWLIVSALGLGGIVLLMSLKKKAPVGPPPLPRRYDWTVPVGNITSTLGTSLPDILGKIPTHWLS